MGIGEILSKAGQGAINATSGGAYMRKRKANQDAMALLEGKKKPKKKMKKSTEPVSAFTK